MKRRTKNVNAIKKTSGQKLFQVFLYVILIGASLSCILPFANLLAISLSDAKYVNAGTVSFLPKGFNLTSYKYILQNREFFRSFLISLERTVLGVAINVFLIVLTAFPLSLRDSYFRGKKIYMTVFVGAMLFTPSLVPLYMVVRSLKMIDTIWALVLPTALPVFNMILMMNFFRSLPREMDEAAYLDGAGYWTILWRIYVPLSKPAIATVTLFSIIAHWNAWLDGMLYMNDPSKYPLQSYLQTIVVNSQQLIKHNSGNAAAIKELLAVNNDTAKSAQLFVAMIPVLLIYPLLQKYFTSGLTAGGVKE